MRGPTCLKDLRKDVILHCRVVHTHRTASDLDTVKDQIVVLPSDLEHTVSWKYKFSIQRRLAACGSPLYRRSISSVMGAVNGWCVLHRVLFSPSALGPNSGNSVIHRKCGASGRTRFSAERSLSVGSAVRVAPDPPCSTAVCNRAFRCLPSTVDPPWGVNQ